MGVASKLDRYQSVLIPNEKKPIDWPANTKSIAKPAMGRSKSIMHSRAAPQQPMQNADLVSTPAKRSRLQPKAQLRTQLE